MAKTILAIPRAGLWMIIASFSLITIWWFYVIVVRPSYLLAVASELGSIAQFGQGRDGDLFPNNAGTALTYFRLTETGLGTYFCNATSGNTKLLFEQKEAGYLSQSGMLGWSPDDKLFACNVLTDSGSTQIKNEIILYDGMTGTIVTKIAANGYQWGSKFVWLSPRSLAFTTYNQAWLVFEQKQDGVWTQTQVIKRFAEGEMTNVTVLSPHALVWQQGKSIWMFDFESEVSGKIWDSTSNHLEGFSRTETGDLLLSCADENGPLSIRFRPSLRKWGTQDSILAETRNELPSRFAKLDESNGLYSFSIKADGDSELQHFPWSGMIETYKLSGNHLFFTGSLPGGAPGIWQYDISSHELNQLVKSINKLVKTKIVAPFGGIITNDLGNRINYHLWQPVNVVPGKKYPLLIGQTHYDFNVWFPYQQVAVNGGYYFATADRISWADGLDKWEPDVMALYSILAKNPNIDTDRVFLFGISWETAFVTDLAEKRPDLWRGIILLSPVRTHTLTNSNLTSVFVAAGKADDLNPVEKVLKFQDDAAKVGIPVKLVLQEGVQHITRSISSERERTRQFARFLIAN